MSQGYLSFLDLMLGYVCAMFILIALSSSDAGRGSIAEHGSYLFVEIEFDHAMNQGEPPLAFVSPAADTLSATKATAETFALRVDSDVVVTVLSIRRASAAGEAQTVLPVILNDQFVQAVPVDRIRRVSVSGELNPAGTSRTSISSVEELRQAIQAVDEFTELVAQLQ